MAFWDASAAVTLCARQPSIAEARRILRRHEQMTVWWGTSVEIRSALARLLREGRLSSETYAGAVRRLGELREWWDEVLPSERVRGVAETLPERFGLRAGDAFQLAAALTWCGERPRNRPFVCLDTRLAQAAAALGFAVER